MIQPLLVTGVQRSGTTFLSNLINSQDEAVVYADFLKGSLFKNAKVLKINDFKKQLSEREKNVMISSLIPEAIRWNLDFRFLWDDDTIKTWYDLFMKVIHFLATQKNGDIKVSGIKITDEKYYLEQLLNNGVKIIFIVRDPRDVILSAKNRFAGFSINVFCERLSEIVLPLKKFKDRENFLIVKYENLINNKVEEANRIKGFLDLTEFKVDIDDLIIRGGNKYVDNSSFGDVKKTFDQSAVYRWKNHAIDDDLIFAETYLQDYILEFGYESNSRATLEKGKKLVRRYKRKRAIKNYMRKVKNVISQILD